MATKLWPALEFSGPQVELLSHPWFDLYFHFLIDLIVETERMKHVSPIKAVDQHETELLYRR